jgi:hypothetical protein
MKYKVMGNRTAADVVASNDEELINEITNLEEAQRLAICAQKVEGFIAAWVEEQEAEAYPPAWTLPGKYEF